VLPDVSAAVPDYVWDELRSALLDCNESAAVLLAGIADTGDRFVLIINRVLWVPAECYVERAPDRLKLASPGWMHALKAAAGLGLHPIFFHTHPRADARPSQADQVVDATLARPFELRAGVSRYASLILGGSADAPTFSGRVIAGGETAPISRLRVVGRRLQIVPSAAHAATGSAHREVHDRQIRAFGRAGQEVLASLHVGVVGTGGTGSAVIEQLARLGVGRITAVDDDHLTKSNVSRVYGSSITQNGLAKVEVAEANVHRIGLGTDLIPIKGRVTQKGPLVRLRECDVLFGCTDDHAGRINLSRLSFWYLIPLIDVGVQIDSDGVDVRSITARVTYVAPGEACLVCRGTVDPDLAREEQIDPAERERLANEGYARGLQESDPSVVAYTTWAAAAGIADLLERVFGFGASDLPGELIVRIADRKMKGRRSMPSPSHFCGEKTEWGRGDQANFLGQPAWPQ
jgi:hypothetical protein